MAIIAAGVLVVSNTRAGHRPPTEQAGATPPPYYVALSRVAHSSSIEVTVRATATGKVLATVANNAPYSDFGWVTAAADDRTFVIAAAKSPNLGDTGVVPVRLYLLRFNPAGDTTNLSQLPISNVTVDTRAVNLSIALSPDGAHLAVIANTFAGLRVYSVRTGTWRAWVASPSVVEMAPSWAADSRTLAYYRFRIGVGYSRRTNVISLLDTTSTDRDLVASSRTIPNILPFPYGGTYAKIAPLGSAIVAPIGSFPGKAAGVIIGQISARTGRVLLRYRLPGVVDTPDVAWVGRSGERLIVVTSPPSPPSGSAHAYLVTARRVTKIPWSSAIAQLPLPVYQPFAW
jgi:hypothetical protein